MRKEIIGNWKMNGLLSSEVVFRELISGYASTDFARLTICPPATLLATFSQIARESGSRISLGGQHCHRAASGSHTGEISASMLRDSGARLTLVGHAERRAAGEDDDEVALQLRAAWSEGLTAVLCVGEQQAAREAGNTRAILREQLSRALVGFSASNPIKLPAEHFQSDEGGLMSFDGGLMLAYEPLWSIGSGKTPSTAQINETYDALRDDVRALLSGTPLGQPTNEISILYGGSVTSANAEMILPLVDGLLLGKASLQAAELLAIVSVANALGSR